MPTATQAGQAGLQGWREKVADGVAEPVAKRTPLDEDQVRAIVGATFLVLTVMYLVQAIKALKSQS
ncbi:MAG TPA: hypothetical protein VGR12_01800 [Solirubrobacteraceae bacterium]|nr:hypothetical protein [Solirubrobacteraceae bacterium]